MDIGNLKNNCTFYDGYEGEPEIILMIVEEAEYSIHMWDGYFDDIFGEPALDGNGWKGFTRDLNQMEGLFSDGENETTIDVHEYLEDARQYQDKAFRYEETVEAFTLLVTFLRYAATNGLTVIAKLV